VGEAWQRVQISLSKLVLGLLSDLRGRFVGSEFGSFLVDLIS
jgi:hypothetical protein